MEYQKTLVNSSPMFKKVHYAENIETRDEIAIEGEKCSDISEISKSSVKGTEDANSEISIDTSILDTEYNDIKTLRKKSDEYESQIKYLENQNKLIAEELMDEKKLNSKLEKKLQFVKDNQEVFMRLKEAYINMKYNEAAGRKMIEIREKSIQTWEGMFCSSCLKSEELRRQIEIMMQKYSELFVISPGEMEHLINTVKYLKDLVYRREDSWAFNMEREHKFQCHIAILEDENAKLKEVIANGQNESVSTSILEDVQLQQKIVDERKIEEMQKFVEDITKDMEKLKKIIIKYEKKFRELKDHNPEKCISPLNDREIKMVQQIIIKFNAKIQKKNMEAARSRSPSMGSERSPQTRRPSSPLRRSREMRMTERPSSVKNIKPYDNRTETAIRMMDCLFD